MGRSCVLNMSPCGLGAMFAFSASFDRGLSSDLLDVPVVCNDPSEEPCSARYLFS